MSFEFVILLFVSLFVALDAITSDGGIQDTLNVPEDGRLNCKELLTKYKYPPEIHYVTTEDGYILEVYHIPGEKTKPLLLLHGVFDTSCGWFLRGNRSLGIMTAKEGYDVWAINNRGNRYSRNHTTLDPNKNDEFWDYSAHEFGYYDLAACIDFILQETGQKKLSLVGFSEGTTSVFVLGSARPEYNDKVKVFVALAPVAFLEHVRPALSYIISFSPILDFFLPQSVQEISGYYSLGKAILNLICTKLPISYELCYLGGMNSVSGPDFEGIEREFFPVIIGHFPAGTSRKNLIHYAKISLQKSFSQYDYGIAKNLKVYHSFKPPVYDLSKMTMHTAAMSGSSDSVSTLEDAKKLTGILPNVVWHRVVNGSNHLEFMWGKDAPETTYAYVLDVLKEFN